MPNRNYNKGRAWEYEVRDRLTAAGWFAKRLPGSKPVDVIAYKEGKLLRVFECKVNHKPPKHYIEEQKQIYWKLGIVYLVAVKNLKGR